MRLEPVTDRRRRAYAGFLRIGDMCVHRGRTVRVVAINRQFAEGMAYMGTKDGTEFNSILTFEVVLTRNGTPPRKPYTFQGYAHQTT